MFDVNVSSKVCAPHKDHGKVKAIRTGRHLGNYLTTSARLTSLYATLNNLLSAYVITMHICTVWVLSSIYVITFIQRRIHFSKLKFY